MPIGLYPVADFVISDYVAAAPVPSSTPSSSPSSTPSPSVTPSDTPSSSPSASSTPSPSATPGVVDGPLVDLRVAITRLTDGIIVSDRLIEDLELAGEKNDQRIIEVGTSEETITINSDIASKGYMYVLNLDAVNYVDFGYATGVYPERIRPNTAALIQLAPSTTTFYVRADTAAVDLLYSVIEANV